MTVSAGDLLVLVELDREPLARRGHLGFRVRQWGHLRTVFRHSVHPARVWSALPRNFGGNSKGRPHGSQMRALVSAWA